MSVQAETIEQKKQTKIETQGNYQAGVGSYKDVIRVALPLIISMGSNTVMQFTDRLFLGRYSVDAIAAALPAAFCNAILLLFFMGICSYSGVFIAQYVGIGSLTKIGKALWQSIYLSIVLGIVMCLFSFGAPFIFELAGDDEVIKQLEITYFQVLCFGAIFSLTTASLGSFFSGLGITRPVMVANIVAMAINVPLDYCLIFGKYGFPELGIFGAGLATVLGSVFSMLILIFLVFTKKNNRIFHVWKARKFDFTLTKRILRYGFPSGVNLFVELFCTTWFIFALGHLGKIVLAAGNITFSISSLGFVPMLGMGLAVSVLVGQSMGRKNIAVAKAATKHGLHIAVGWMVVMSAFYILFPEFLFDLFKASVTDPDAVAQFIAVKEQGKILLFFVSVYCIFDAVYLAYAGALKGTGDTMFVMWAGILTGFGLLVIPGTLLFYFDYASVLSLWFLFTFYIVSLAIILWLRFRAGGWQKIVMVENN